MSRWRQVYHESSVSGDGQALELIGGGGGGLARRAVYMRGAC
jgi:hypothetical protein